MAVGLFRWSDSIVSLSLLNSITFVAKLISPLYRAVIGALGSSYVADKIGRKLVYLFAFLVMLVGITLETVATTNPMFFAGKFINGFSVGAFGTVTMTYLGEVCVYRAWMSCDKHITCC